MINTFTFVFKIRANENIKSTIYSLMEEPEPQEYDIDGRMLNFDQKRKL